MAEAAVESVLQNLQILQAHHIEGAESHIEKLERNILLLQAFLKDSIKKQDANLEELLREIREVVYDADDVIDALVTQANLSKSKDFETPELARIADVVDSVGCKVKDIYDPEALESSEAEVEFVLQKLERILTNDKLLIESSESHIEKLENDLHLFEAFINDPTKKLREDKELKELLRQMHDLVYDAEDVIDAFMTQTEVNVHGITKVVDSVRDIYGRIDLASPSAGKRDSSRELEVDVENYAATKVVKGLSKEISEHPVLLTPHYEVPAAETRHVSTIEENLETFHTQIFSRFHDLSIAKPEDLLSISWINKLLDTFTSCQEDFRLILSDNSALLSIPVSYNLTFYFDQAIKAMDIFNATRDGIQTIRLWQKHIEIILTSLNPQQQRSLGEGQFRRSRKALMDLAVLMVDDKETGSVFSHRNRSFNRKGTDHMRAASGGHTRSDNWSASKQLQLIANSLSVPRADYIAATNGLASVIFSMGFVLMFVLWVLVAAIPCQGRGMQINFTIPRQFEWSSPILIIHTRIMDEFKKRDGRHSSGLLKELGMDEFKKRDGRHSSGLLKELYEIEKNVYQLIDLVDNAQFPLSDEVKEQVRGSVDELSSVYEVCKTGLDPLERKLRDVI